MLSENIFLEVYIEKIEGFSGERGILFSCCVPNRSWKRLVLQWNLKEEEKAASCIYSERLFKEKGVATEKGQNLLREQETFG